MTRLDWSAASARAAGRPTGALPPTEPQLREIARLLEGLGKGPLRRTLKTRSEASRLIDLLRSRAASVRLPS